MANPCTGSALFLLVLGIFADDHDAALALDNLAFLADRFDGRSDFHGGFLLDLAPWTDQKQTS